MGITNSSPSRRSGASCCRIVPLFLAVLCAIGIAPTWLLAKRTYTVSGVIRVAPVVSNIGIGKKDRGGISDFADFLARQATMITCPQVVERVANDLAGKGLKFSEKRAFGTKNGLRENENHERSRLESTLNKAVLDETITATPPRRGEIIVVNMRWTDGKEAKTIVDSFIKQYIMLAAETASNGDKQSAQISPLEKADITQIHDERGHYTVALLIGFSAFGILSILLQGKGTS